MKYQDYVIKDGKFVGKFEEMYKNCQDPWNQTNSDYVENSISRQAVCNYIKKYKIKSIIEFGCGFGKTSKFIKDLTNVNITGIDISETSIDKARLFYPEIEFFVDDIENIDLYNFDCYFFSEIVWYLLHDKKIDRIFEKMKNQLAGKYFINNLVFYKGNQRYGLEYFSSLNEFIEFSPFELLGKISGEFKDDLTVETSTIFKI